MVTEKYLIIHMFKNMANMYKVASPKRKVQDVHARMLDGKCVSDVHSCMTA